MNQQLRILLAFVLSAVILFGWNYLYGPKPPAPGQKPAPSPTAQVSPAPADGSTPTPLAEAPEAPAPEPEPEPQTVTVDTELWTATFSSQGAALTSFELKGRKQETPGQGSPVNLAHPGPGQPLPLSVDLGDDVPADLAYRVVRQSDTELVFERTRGATTVQKRFSWKPGTYQLALEVSVRGADGQVPAAPVTLHYSAYEPPGTRPSRGFFSSFGPQAVIHRSVCHLAGEGRSLETHTYDADEPVVNVRGTPSFTGIDEKYFIAAMSAAAGAQGASCRLGASRPGALEAMLSSPLDAAGRALFDLYIGPKEPDLLEAAGHELQYAVDYGFWALICRALLVVLRAFEKLVQNWGVAIILLTLLVKALTFPLTHRQMKSMDEMRRLQPKLEEIRKKYGNDQQRVNTEMMKMYREHNVQPLGGCLPMLVQMPVWFALYTMLSTSFDLYNEPFIGGWINDLTSRDPFYALPIAMTVTMVLSQMLTPQTQQTQQMKYTMYGMSVFFGFIMMSLPAGLVLYIFTNNVLSIGQSLWFRKRFGTDVPAAAR